MSVLRCSLPLVLMLAMGCGDGRVKLPMAPVTGTVTYQSRPLSTARIIFVHDSGQAVATDLAVDGTFKLTAFQGENRVALQNLDVTQTSNSILKSAAGKSSVESPIPTRYTEYATSGLTFEVKPDENNKAEFVLKD